MTRFWSRLDANEITNMLALESECVYLVAVLRHQCQYNFQNTLKLRKWSNSFR